MEPDNKNARPILRYAEIRRIQKLEAHLVTKAGAKPLSRRPLTFSIMTASGCTSWIIRKAAGKRLRSSASPSCLPADVNGGQGRPAAARSVPGRASRVEGPDITLDDRPAGPFVLQCPACAATVRLI